MSYRVIIRKTVVKEIEKLPLAAIKRISSAIDGLSLNPRPEGCKKLKGEKEFIWRIRVGDYKILYTIEDIIKVVDIRRIGHRRDVYD